MVRLTTRPSVQVLGVNFDGLQGGQLSQAAQDMNITFTVLAQDPAERYQLPRAEVLPVTFIVDPQGRMRERLLGEQTAAGLTAHLAALKAQAKREGRSLSALVSRILAAATKRHEAKRRKSRA